MKNTTILLLLSTLVLTSCCKDNISNPAPTPTINLFETLPSNTTNTITDISFINENNGIICGEFGFFAKTTDGGKSWNTINTGINYSFISTFMLDNNKYFVARNGLYKSSNAGSSFAEAGKLSQNQSSIPKIYFTDSLHGIITQSAGVLQTKDGGKNWSEKYNTNLYYGINNLQFISTNIAYASGGRTFDQTNEGEIIKTMDGGDSWSKILSTINVTALYFINDLEGYYTTFNKELFKTTDGGNSWSKITVINYLPLSIVFVNSQLGYVATNEGKILKTTNAGQSWVCVFEKTSVPIVKIIANHGAIFAIGGDGLLIKTK